MLVKPMTDGAFRLARISGRLNGTKARKYRDENGNVYQVAPFTNYTYHDGDAYDPREFVLIG